MEIGNLVEWTPKLGLNERGNIGVVIKLDKLLKKAKVHWIAKPRDFDKNGTWAYLRNITLLAREKK
jgi:hypothetical protein